jgi:hypothetical protein
MPRRVRVPAVARFHVKLSPQPSEAVQLSGKILEVEHRRTWACSRRSMISNALETGILAHVRWANQFRLTFSRFRL